MEQTNETILYFPAEQILVTPSEISKVKRDIVEFLVVNKVFRVIGEL
jgi:hypothetical protein